MPKTSCMERTSVPIKKMSTKQPFIVIIRFEILLLLSGCDTRNGSLHSGWREGGGGRIDSQSSLPKTHFLDILGISRLDMG